MLPNPVNIVKYNMILKYNIIVALLTLFLPNKITSETLVAYHLTYLMYLAVPTQQTQDLCITFVQRRPNVFDVGPALYKCYTNVLC